MEDWFWLVSFLCFGCSVELSGSSPVSCALQIHISPFVLSFVVCVSSPPRPVSSPLSASVPGVFFFVLEAVVHNISWLAALAPTCSAPERQRFSVAPLVFLELL